MTHYNSRIISVISSNAYIVQKNLKEKSRKQCLIFVCWFKKLSIILYKFICLFSSFYDHYPKLCTCALHYLSSNISIFLGSLYSRLYITLKSPQLVPIPANTNGGNFVTGSTSSRYSWLAKKRYFSSIDHSIPVLSTTCIGSWFILLLSRTCTEVGNHLRTS